MADFQEEIDSFHSPRQQKFAQYHEEAVKVSKAYIRRVQEEAAPEEEEEEEYEVEEQLVHEYYVPPREEIQKVGRHFVSRLRTSARFWVPFAVVAIFAYLLCAYIPAIFSSGVPAPDMRGSNVDLGQLHAYIDDQVAIRVKKHAAEMQSGDCSCDSIKNYHTTVLTELGDVKSFASNVKSSLGERLDQMTTVIEAKVDSKSFEESLSIHSSKISRVEESLESVEGLTERLNEIESRTASASGEDLALLEKNWKEQLEKTFHAHAEKHIGQQADLDAAIEGLNDRLNLIDLRTTSASGEDLALQLQEMMQQHSEKYIGQAELENAITAASEELLEKSWTATKEQLELAIIALQQDADKYIDQAELENAITAASEELLEKTATKKQLELAITSLGEKYIGQAELDAYIDQAELENAITAASEELLEKSWTATNEQLGRAITSLGEKYIGQAELDAYIDQAELENAITAASEELLVKSWTATNEQLGRAITSLGEKYIGQAELDAAIANQKREWKKSVDLLEALAEAMATAEASIDDLNKSAQKSEERDVAINEILVTNEKKHGEFVEHFHEMDKNIDSLEENQKILAAVKTVTPGFVEGAVEQAIEDFAADRTAKTDYAAFGAGAMIITDPLFTSKGLDSTEENSLMSSIFGFNTKNFDNPPDCVLKHGTGPGECWLMKGPTGSLLIQLAQPIVPTSFSIESMDHRIRYGSGATPRKFTVVGFVASDASRISEEGSIVLVEAEYNPIGKQVQSFKRTGALERRDPIKFIQLKIRSNDGNPKFTCLHRFRVHGEPIGE